MPYFYKVLKKGITSLSIYKRIISSDIGRRMASGAFWSFTGTALAKFIVLVAGIACAHVLGKEEYGQFGMVRSTINMFVVFGFAGMGLTATKFISEYKKEHKERIPSIYILTNGFAVLMGFIITTVVLLFSSYIAKNTLHSPELTLPLRMGALLLFVTVLNGAQQGTLAGFENFKAIAINTLIGSIAESILMLIGAYYWGVTGAVLGFGCGFVVLYITNKLAINRNLKDYSINVSLRSLRTKDLKLLYTYSLPAFLFSLVGTPVYWIIRTLLVNYRGFGELANFEAAEQWRVLVIYIPTILYQVLLPIFSSMNGTSSKKSFSKLLHFSLLVNTVSTLLLSLIITLFSNSIMNLYGKEFNDNMSLICLVFSTISNSALLILFNYLSSKNKMWTIFFVNLFCALLSIVSTLVLLENGMGASAVGLSFNLSYTIGFILLYIYLRKNEYFSTESYI